MLSLRDVSYVYPNGHEGVRNVSFEVGQPELLTLLGPNGSGKSTLLKLLARVMVPSRGGIALEGRAVSSIAPREYARRVGYLAQELEVSLVTRALDVVLTGRAPHLGRMQWESEHDLEVSRRALRWCDAEALSERDLREMSGGEKKRVFLARVLAGDPEIVLLDEPLASLDVQHVQALLGLLRRMVDEQRRTVILISHDFNWASTVSDRVAVMSDGRLAAIGKPSEVLTREMVREVFGIESEILEGPLGVGWIVPAGIRR